MVMIEESQYMHVYKSIDTIHIREWTKFLTSESYHRLKEVMTVLRSKMKKQVVLKQELPHLQFFKRYCYQFGQHSKIQCFQSQIQENNSLFKFRYYASLYLKTL
jgi:hypothetical protein